MYQDYITIQEADPARHFAAIACLMSTFETEPSTADSLAEWYHKQLEDGIWFTVALSQRDEVLAFNGLYRNSLSREKYYGAYLAVGNGYRGCGLGSLMYEHLLDHAFTVGARTLVTWVRDNNQESLRFATRHGFKVKKHSIEMMFDLTKWDESRYQPILEGLRSQGFQFTNMAELGDTLEARRKLFALNNGAAATDPGNNGIPPWASFEEFNRNVCSKSWYHPDSQMIAIDTHTGEWAAMSAITVFNAADHAYNLFTGTAVHYRGRKLAQAVKALALRWARENGVDTVRTSHNSENTAMIAIDTKLGYVRTPGQFVMEKELDSNQINLISNRPG